MGLPAFKFLASFYFSGFLGTLPDPNVASNWQGFISKAATLGGKIIIARHFEVKLSLEYLKLDHR
jgi:hypothetical protein